MKKRVGLLICILMIINLLSSSAYAGTVNPNNIKGQTQEDIITMKANDNSAIVKYSTHVQNIGWNGWKTNGETAGTVGRGLRVEALKITIEGSENASISYRAHVQNKGWMNWVSNGETAGTEGKGLRVEALQIEAKNLPEGYHLIYRAHVQNKGWQDWVSNGEVSGTVGSSLRIEALEIKVVQNDKYYSNIQYSSKAIGYEWTSNVYEAQTTGSSTTDLEAFNIDLDNSIGLLKYRAYIENYGWQDWKNNNEVAGGEGSKKKIKAIQLDVSGLADNVQCLYRVYLSDIGWQDWKNSGDVAGDIGGKNNIRAIQVKLEDREPSIEYVGHVQNIGWQDWKTDGDMAGTTGKNLRIEGIKIKLCNFENASITYRVHVQKKGWMNWESNGEIAGTIGESLRVEAIQIKGKGLPSTYQVQYRAHVQNVGWQDWKTDGQIAGTTGRGLRIEAIQIRIVRATKIAPMQYIDSPSDNSIITDNFTVSGWSLNYSGVKKIEVYVGDKLVGETIPSIAREDVYNAYPQYGIHNSGYELDVDIKTIPPGDNQIEVRQYGNDGYIHHAYKQITIKKKDNITTIDAPASGYLESKDKLYIKGWALNGSGVEKVNVYIDNVLKATIKTDQTRNDVAKVYPGYNNDNKSGYTTNISLSGLKAGKHTLRISPIGYDGTVKEVIRDFYYKNHGVTIAVDAGHNYGGDYGATATHNGITYSETELNMKIADYLKTYLENAGYNVVMTRNSADRDQCNVNQSLANRVSIANKSDATLFISIHQNAATPSAHGVEVFSTTNNPDRGYSWDNYSDKINKSKQLATKVVNSIASSVGFYNRGAKTANLYVLRNTRMPAILVECGFITNYSNATALAVDLNQRKIASSIADQVKTMY